MAKELPYFKFEPSSWDSGNIQCCSLEQQGIFINLCCLYWQRLGDLPYKLALSKICGGNAVALDSLIDTGVIEKSDDYLIVGFLREQLSEFENLSKENRKNALNGWKKRKNSPNATAMRPHSDRNAIREDKRRGDKIQIDENFNFSIAKIFNKPYKIGLDRGMANEGLETDTLISQLKAAGWSYERILAQAKAMKACYIKQKWAIPSNFVTLLTSLTENDWVQRLKEFDPDQQEKIIRNGKNIKPEIDTIGSNAPGSLG